MNSEHPIHIESDEFCSMITKSLDGFLLADVTGNILEANDSYCRMVGYTREELVNMHISEVDAIESFEDVSKRVEEIIKKGALRFEVRHRHKNGSTIDIEVCSNYSAVKGGIFFSTIRDISEHKRTRGIIDVRLRLMEGSINNSIEDLLREALDEAENLTGSCIGFYHFLDSDQEMLTLKAWSTQTATKFCKADAAGSHYNISLAGVWADCVRERHAIIHNDYASLPDRKGMPDGHAVVVRELVVPVFRNGNIVAILGVGNKPSDYDQSDVDLVTLLADIAYGVVEKKQLDTSLRQSEERYRNIVENQTELVDRYLPGGILTYVNESLVKFVGVPKEDLLGISFYPFIHEADREETVSRIESISKENPVVKTVGRTILPDGRFRWNSWSHTGFFDDKGAVIEYQSVGRDITERKMAENALAESERAFKKLSTEMERLLETSSTGLTRCTRDLYYLSVNTAYAKLTGFPREQIIGKPIVEIMGEKGLATIMPYLKRVLNGERVEYETPLLFKAGDGARFLHVVYAPDKDEEGAVIGWVASITDITEQKRAENDRMQFEQQLQQAQRLESLGVLAGGIAHDFNNILAIIMGHCTLIEMDYRKAPDYIPQIEKAVARAAELCRQMLAYAGKAQFVQAQVNIAVLVEEMVKMLRSTFKQNVEIIASIDHDIPSIKADASQIRQIAMNLITNGAEAIGDAQGEVRVVLAKAVIKTGSSKKDYLGKIIPAGWYACLEVTDNGSGMSDETYNRIFEPFYTTKFTGRGLGLSAVLGIVTAQGGALQLSSQLGKGTTFKVYLPLPISDAIAGEPGSV